jgi:hypothetical protein
METRRISIIKDTKEENDAKKLHAAITFFLQAL